MLQGDRAGRLRRLARISLAVAIVVGLAGVALHPGSGSPGVAARSFATGGPGGGGGGGPSQNLSVNITDKYPYYAPGNLSATAGATVTFQVHNLGDLNHTFTVATLGNFTIPINDSPQELAAFFAANGSLVNVSVGPHASANATVALPSSDAGISFEFVSLVPYQFQAGMHGVLHVGYATSAGSFTLTTQTTDSLRFVPDILVVPNATSFPIQVSVSVSNLGTTAHTFTLEAQNNNTLLPNNFTSYFSSHAPLADVDVKTTPGVPVYANFSITGKGAFEFICTVPGHFAAGMFGWLYVGYTPSPPPAPPSSAIVDVALLAGAGGLVVVAVVLTVVATFVGRFPKPPTPPGPHG